MPCILLVGKYPKPSENPFTTYYTAQGDFAEVLKEIFQKVFLTSYYGGRAGNAKDMQKKNAAICDASIISYKQNERFLFSYFAILFCSSILNFTT